MDRPPINKLLQRQFKRSFGKDAPISKEMERFLLMISQSYEHYEKDRKIIDRAMELSSQELRSSYEKLVVQKELERKNEDLQQFVSIASHDLKAPLRTIKSFTQILEKSLGDNLPEGTKDYITFIKSGVDGMNALILDLLEYAKVGTSNKEKEKVDLNKIIGVAQRNLSGIINDNKARIEIDHLPVIEYFPSQMLQLFQNLIGNAIKFKKKNVPPVVKITCSKNETEYIISIIDNGIGIPESEKEKVFEIFQRLAGASKYEGSGLGLSICKKIIEKLGGKIWVESELGFGTTFHFTIPLENEVIPKKVLKKNKESISV